MSKIVIGRGVTIKNVQTANSKFIVTQINNQFVINDIPIDGDVILSDVVYNNNKLSIGGVEYTILNGKWCKQTQTIDLNK
jgi:hypothetical protein